MTLVEKMAKAMYERRPFVKPWDDEEAQRLFGKSMRLDALAALKTMREPTGSMIDAVSNRIIPPTETMRAVMRAAVVSDWQAMIDQAIKEGE